MMDSRRVHTVRWKVDDKSALPSTFQISLVRVLDLPIDTLQQIGDELGRYPGFLSAKTQDEIISGCVDGGHADIG